MLVENTIQKKEYNKLNNSNSLDCSIASTKSSTRNEQNYNKKIDNMMGKTKLNKDTFAHTELQRSNRFKFIEEENNKLFNKLIPKNVRTKFESEEREKKIQERIVTKTKKNIKNENPLTERKSIKFLKDFDALNTHENMLDNHRKVPLRILQDNRDSIKIHISKHIDHKPKPIRICGHYNDKTRNHNNYNDDNKSTRVMKKEIYDRFSSRLSRSCRREKETPRSNYKHNTTSQESSWRSSSQKTEDYSLTKYTKKPLTAKRRCGNCVKLLANELSTSNCFYHRNY